MKKKGFFDDRDPFSGKGEGEGEKCEGERIEKKVGVMG